MHAGNKFVFRSTRDGGPNKYKNLYIMDNSVVGANGGGKLTRLTNGPWTDTHCQWSPSGDWIVFSSTRDKPATAPPKDFGLDPGYFAVYLVKADDPTVVVRVMRSGSDLSGHVNHPVFSPDCRSIVVTSDLAAVSVDPISLPLFVHSVRPYGDIFVIDIDSKDITKNKDVQSYKRITHSRYENSTPCWTVLSPDDPRAPWTTTSHPRNSGTLEPALLRIAGKSMFSGIFLLDVANPDLIHGTAQKMPLILR
jgi:Tol biopolymer transport system component